MKKILIVEDDRFLASAYKLGFDGVTYQADIVEDGKKPSSILMPTSQMRSF